MTAVKNSSGTALASYAYDNRSRRTGLDYTNGAGTDYSYDTASRLLHREFLTPCPPSPDLTAIRRRLPCRGAFCT
jgi:hypothetical protein